MSFDIHGARNEGYTDSQIADHLSALHGYDVAGARAEGYADAQIAEHLAARSTTLAKAKNAAAPKSVANIVGAIQPTKVPDSIQPDPTRIITTTADRATDFAVNKVIAERGVTGAGRADDSMAETSRFLQGNISESPQARIDRQTAENAEGMARNTTTPEQQEIYDRANAASREQIALDKSPVPRGITHSAGTFEAPVEALTAAHRRDAPETSVTSDVGEVGRQLVAGGIDLAGMAGKAGQAVTGGRSGADLEQWANEAEKGWEPNLDGRGPFASAFIRGARSVVPSLSVATPYLLAGGIGVPTKLAMALGDTGTIALFGGSAYTDTKRKIERQNPFGEGAWKAGVLSAASQGGLEVVQNRFTLGLLGAGKGVTKETMNAMLGMATDKSVFKPFAAAYGKAMVGEPATEAIQDTSTELVERAYGARPTDLWEITKDSVTATMGMVTLTAPFGIVGHYRNAKQAAAIDEILSNPNHPIEARQSVVDMLYRQGVSMRAPDAAIWLAGAKTDIDNNRPIRRAADGNADPAQADAALGAAVHGAISADAALGTPEPAIPFPDAKPGSVSSAANVAAKHGLTPQNASILPSPTQPTQEQGNASQATQTITPETQQQTQGIPTNAVAGHPSEVVLPDNTALPAQWEVVDADQITATLKEGKNQPRDRSRATSDVQVNGIANAPDYRRLSDSPVMDVGAPTLSMDGAIVGGNGRFEGVSRAYDNGTAGEYLARLNADAQAKGIDPGSFAGMKKPVLVRRITQPLDTRAVAVASNSGGSLQYSALELAKIDGERMATLGDIEVNDAGDIEMTVQNMQNVRRALTGYTAAELGSMSDKDGMLSQEGIRRLKNAMMYKAYGNSPTLSRLIESTDSELRSVSGALVRAAGSVAGVRADMATGAVSASTDIATDLVVAVELLSKIKSSGGSVEQYLAQHGLFKGEYTEAAATILRFLSENIRSQKRMAEFIRAYYDALASEDTQTGSMFEDLPPATKQERLNHAKQQTEAGAEKTTSGPAGVAGAQDQQQPQGAQGTTEGGGGSQQAAVTGNGTQAAPIKVETTEHLRVAEENVNTAPTAAQKEAGNYQKAHVQWNGLDITIENPKGSERSGKDADGGAWSVTMPASYGYIKRTEGADGDHIDVYLGEDHQSQQVYIIDQVDVSTGKFDEHKTMLGFASQQDVERTYKSGFSDGKGAARMGAITPMSLDELKEWIKTEDTTKPVGKISAPILTSPTTEELAQRERAAEQAKADEEAQAKKAQSERDAADLAARTKARVENADNFQFGESSKQAAKPVGDLFAQPATETKPSPKPEHPLAAALRQYEDTGEIITVGELVNEVERLIDDDQAPSSLQSAVEDYRQEVADDHNLYAGRGDMESADEAFLDAVRSGIVDADMDAALNDLGAILRDVAGVKRIMPEDHEKLLPVLVKLFEAAFRKGYYDLKAAARYVRKILAEHAATKAFANFIPNALMDKAAKEAASKMPDGFFENQGLFTQSEPAAKEAQPAEITISDIPATLKIANPSTGRGQFNARKIMDKANKRIEKLTALRGCLG